MAAKVLVVLLALWGLGAVGGGVGMAGAPDGSAIGFDTAMLDGTPFGDFLLPGLLLLALGVGSLVAAGVLGWLVRRGRGPLPGWVCGGLVLLAVGINAWIFGEIAFLWDAVAEMPADEQRFYYVFWVVYAPVSLLIAALTARVVGRGAELRRTPGTASPSS